jgi:4-diphosphocytidyl-2-C-methyl-D-erythritol kinase
VHLAVTKAIPVAGGMAGGSADAAAALVACDVLWSTRTPPEVLRRMAATLGSDVPFALVGGSALGTGRGEEVTPIPAAGGFWWVVVESGRGLSTPAVYRELDRMRPAPQPEQPPAPEALIAALESGDAVTLGAALSNDLQPAALRLRPDLAEVLAMGPELAALGTVLSGSGPTCLFLADSESSAVRMAARLGDMGLGPVTVAPGPVPGARVRTDLPENSG